jgi:Dihaem cytochrome c.
MIKHINIASCFLFLFFVIAACTSSKNTNTKEKNDDANPELIAAKQKVPGITMEMLRSGSRAYIRRCSGCHALHKPSQFTAQQWHPILIKMFEKAKVRDSTTRILITDYLAAKSK